jgi:hypothetical protein
MKTTTTKTVTNYWAMPVKCTFIALSTLCTSIVSAKGKDEAKSPNNPLAYNKIYSRICKQVNTTLEIIDANVTVFDNAFSNAVDGDDAVKMNNSGENLAIKRENKLLVVEGRQAITDKDTIYLEMWNMLNQTYKLEIDATLMNVNGLTATLIDKYTSINTNLNIGFSNVVTFSCDANAASKVRDRFKIVFRKLNSLPVSFLNVEAKLINNIAQVNWQVTSQVNVKSYCIEKSMDGKNYTTIKTIPAKNQQALVILYSVTDENLASGKSFYRIKNIDLDGAFTFSTVVTLNNISTPNSYITVYPNPITNKVINLNMFKYKNGNYMIKIFSKLGQLLQQNTLQHQLETTQHAIQLSPNVVAGFYFIQVVDEKGKANSFEINVQ